MGKRVLSAVLALVLCVSLLPGTVWAADIVASGYCGGEGDGTNLTWTLSSEGTLTISGTGVMEDYHYTGFDFSAISSPWYDLRDSMESVVINSGVANIGNFAFSYCSNLMDVSIPSSVSALGNNAFYGCSSLMSVDIPQSVTSTGGSVFNGCSSLAEISIPSGVTNIGPYEFYGCSSLKNVSIPNTVTHIESWAFANCTSLKHIQIPRSVIDIDYHAFSGCTGLTDIVIPYGVVSIGTYTFENCNSLQNVDIPGSVSEIGNYLFSKCSSLEDVKLGYGITKIGTSAFFNCTNLGSIDVPDSVDSIGERAFYGCSNLSEVQLHNGVTYIGGSAFYNCSSLESITLPTSLTNIYGVFRQCTGLKSIVLPNGLPQIASEAFYHCYALKSIVIPVSVTSIGFGAFDGSDLTDIYYCGSEEQWKQITVWGSSVGTYTIKYARKHYNSSGVIPVQADENVPFNQYCLHVVDENGQPISGAGVVWGDSANTLAEITDECGNAYFNDFTIGNPLITVSQTGYTTWSNENSNWKKSPSRYETVILYPESYGAYKLREAWYANNSLMTGSSDILANTKKLNLKNDGNLIGDLTNGKFYIACSAVSNDGIVRYELWQKDKKITEATAGWFGELSVESFSKGGGCFIRVVTADGKQVDTNINLEFAENTINKASSFTLKGKKATFKVDDDVPYLGGSTLNFDLPINVPVIYEETEDTFKVGLNMKLTNNKSTAEQMEDFHKLLERTSSYGTKGWTQKNKDNFKGHLQQYNEADFFKKCNVTFAAYFEGDCASAKGTGYLAILVDLDVLDLEYNTIIVVVPVSVQIGIDFTLEVGAKASYSFSDGTLSGNVMLNPSVKLEAFGGVAASKFAGVGAYGSAALLIIYNLFGTEDGLRSIDLTGELGLKAYAGPLTYQRPFAHNTWHLYTANNVQARAAMLMAAAPWDEGIYDVTQYYIDDLSYLAAESDWLGGSVSGDRRMLMMAATPAAAKTAFTPLLTDTYRNAQPVMASSGDALYAAFVRADAETGVRYVAVTKYTDGTTWASPVRVDANAILDDAPTLCVAGDGTVWMAYARTTKEPGNSLQTYAQNQEIVVGSIDPDTLAFAESSTYTGSGFAHMQQLAVLNNQPVLMWADTALTGENSVLLPASGSICYATYSGGAWSEATELANVSGAISSVTPGIQDDSLAAAYLSNGTLYCATADGETSTLAMDVSGHVCYGVLPGASEAAFIWNGDGVLNSSNGNTISAGGITHEYAIVGDKVYYSMATDNSANLAVLQYADSNWSLPIQLTGDSRYLENLSVAHLSGSDYVLGMHTAVTISEDSVEDAKNLVYSRVMPVSDLRIDGIDYDDSELAAGQDIPVTLTVTNAGDHSVSSVELSLDGSTVKTQSVNLLPGECAEITTTIVCPSALTSYAFAVSEPGESDYTPSDNSYEISIGYADAAVELAYQQIGTSKALVATVTNQGIDTASGSVVFYDANGDAVAESTFENLAAGDVAIATYELDAGFAGISGGDVSAVATLTQDELYTYNNSDSLYIMEPSTEIHSVVVSGATVEASIYCESGTAATAYCAVYSNDGKMLTVESKRLDAGTNNSFNIVITSDQAASVKVFVLNEKSVPLCAHKESRL